MTSSCTIPCEVRDGHGTASRVDVFSLLSVNLTNLIYFQLVCPNLQPGSLKRKDLIRFGCCFCEIYV